MFLLPHLLRRFVHKGRLTVIGHAGDRHTFGSGADGPDVTIRLMDAKVERQLFLNPELATAEAYMDGRLEFENGSTVYDLLMLFSVNRRGLAAHPLQQALRKVWKVLRTRHQNNPTAKSASNVKHHYDISTPFYRLWLDGPLNYSCAYFTDPDQSLEQAQIEKNRHIAAKLKLEPGMHVAEIGSGWGFLAVYLAKTFGVQVTSVTLSSEQIIVARERAEREGVAHLVTFIEQDYRELPGSYDRVVSVGMFEHVGVAYFDAYFQTIKRLLKPGGFALVHSIGRMAPPGTTAPFIRKYIFPGGYVPALSEVFASTERTGLWVADCEVLRMHYYWTIRQWRLRFAAQRAQVVAMMDERFARMWEFYLSAVELGFLHGSNMVFHLLLSERRDDVPVIRDYVTDADRELRARPDAWLSGAGTPS
ncbi:MAG: Cyclopropane-fatty-acyl-phospholipid synthase [Xanthobacteraceae bacterium]|nr:Cyclopropane-fatty-acyl-phospholipid synthase [Xanthobacteraceae bacterium]